MDLSAFGAKYLVNLRNISSIFRMFYKAFISQIRKGQILLQNPVNRIIFFIFLVGILLRLLGVYPGFNQYHPDEGKAGFSSAWYMLSNRTFDLPHYNYPAVIPLTELILMIITYIPLMWVKFIVTNFELVATHLNQLSGYFPNLVLGNPESSQFYLPLMYWARYITVIFSVLTMVLLYKISNLLFSSRKAAILAILLLAVNFRMVAYSQLDLPDTFNAFFLLLAFWILLKLKNKPSMKWYLLSGIGIGVAISAKLQFFSLLPFALIHLYQTLMVKDKMWKKILHLVSNKLIVSIFSLILTLLLINWGPLNHWQEFNETIYYQAIKYGIGNFTINTSSLTYLYQIILTPAVAIAFFFGVVMGLKRKTFSTILVLSIIIPFLFYILYYTRGWIYPRNFVTVVPLIILLAGFGLATVGEIISKFISNIRIRQIIFLLLVSLTIYESFKNSVIHTWSYSQPWSLVSMRSCLRNKTPEGVMIASHPWDKYTLFSVPSLDVYKKLNFSVLDPEIRYSAAELKDEQIKYALVGLDVLNDTNSNWWMATKRINFWKKPIKISENTFASLAALELSQHTLCHAIKPWQAPDNNYFFSRVPDHLDFEGNLINNFNFNNEEELRGWKKVDGWIESDVNLLFDPVQGHREPGSLKIRQANTEYPVVRWISPMFAVTPGKGYKVKAWVKAPVNLSIKERDGFLRLDFSKSEPKTWNEETLGESVTLSARYYGLGDWKELEVEGVAPPDTINATVSFQASNPPTANFWMDDLTIEESRDNIFQTKPESEYQLDIDEDVMVPYLGGGF